MLSSSITAVRRKLVAWAAVAAFISGLFLLTTSSVASAAGNGLWSISPTSVPGQGQRQYFNYLVSPGSTVSDAVTVYNQTNAPLPLRLYPADAVNAQGGGYSLLTPNKSMHSIGKWTSMGDEEFTLPPKSLAKVPIDINVPGTATPGDYAGGVVLRPVNPAIERRHNLTFAVYQAVGTRVYLRVKGPLHPRLEVTHLAINPDTGISGLFGGPMSADVTYTFKNTGNQILNPTTHLKVSPLIGGATTVTQPFSSIIPGNAVTVTRHISSTEALFHLSANLSVSDTKPQAATETAAASATIIPWLAILVIVLLVAAYVVLRRRRRHHQAPPAGPAAGSPEAPAPVGAGTK